MKPILLAAFLLCAATLVPAADTVDWRDAARCAGRVCAVRGTVVTQEDEDGVIRLYFDRARRDVSVLLVRSLFVTWPSYTGRDIVATGEVRKFRDRFEVVVSRPSAIEIGGAATPPPIAEPTPTLPSAVEGTDVPPAKDLKRPTPESSEVERLRRRVQELEGRVRELEGGSH